MTKQLSEQQVKDLSLLIENDASVLSRPIRVLDLAHLRENYQKLKYDSKFKVHTAVKACSAPGVLNILMREGSSFEIASEGELSLLINTYEQEYGTRPSKEWIRSNIFDTHPERGSQQEKRSIDEGIDTFTFQDLQSLKYFSDNLRKKGKDPKNYKIAVRLDPTPPTIDRELSAGEKALTGGRFGVKEDYAKSMIDYASESGFTNIAISFHTGTHQEDTHAWDYSVEVTSRLVKYVRSKGLTVPLLDIGGGFTSDLENYEETVRNILASLEKGRLLDIPICIEPGRSIVAKCGTTYGVVDNANILREQIKTSIGLYNSGIFGFGNSYFFIRPNENGDLNTVNGDKKPVVPYGGVCASLDKYFTSPIKVPENIERDDVFVVTESGCYAGERTMPWCSLPQLSTIIIPETATQGQRKSALSLCKQYLENDRMQKGYYKFEFDGDEVKSVQRMSDHLDFKQDAFTTPDISVSQATIEAETHLQR